MKLIKEVVILKILMYFSINFFFFFNLHINTSSYVLGFDLNNTKYVRDAAL